MTDSAVPASVAAIQRILILRGERVIVDSDLAKSYEVATKRLNEQVRRNRSRFPVDFIFRPIGAEKAEAVANRDHPSNISRDRARDLEAHRTGSCPAEAADRVRVVRSDQSSWMDCQAHSGTVLAVNRLPQIVRMGG